METKQCSKCKEVKPVSEFYKHLQTKDRLHSSCKKCIKKYYQENREKICERDRKRYQENIDKERERSRKYREKNKEEISKRGKKYHKENRERINKRRKERRNKDPLYKLSHNIRALIGISIRENGYTKNSKTQDILGISFEGFKEHIKKQFTEGMSWDNKSNWHLDHIIPVASANNEEEIHLLNHHLNFQPLWAEDNISKSDKYTEADKQAMLTNIKLWKK